MRRVWDQLMDSVLRPFAQVRPGERKKTFLMFSFFFLTISLIYILKPVRSSLFLGEFGAEKLPFVYIGEGLWLILVVWAYTWVAKRVSKLKLYLGVLVFMIANLAFLWFLFGRQIDYLSAFFYIWVASFSITMTTVFWTLANDIFNPLEAKRLFGIIISGGSLGGILGGFITNKAVQYMRTEDLLLLSAAILMLCIFFLFLLAPEIRGVEAPPAEPQKHTGSKGSRSIMKLLRGSSYLLMLAAIVIIAKVSSTIIDAQFNKVVEISVSGTEARTAYFGAFWAWLNGISFCMQFFMTSVILRLFGVGFSLWLLPAGLAMLSAVSFFYPVLLVAQLLRIYDGSANYSIQLASKETLYLPLSSSLRHRVKPVIDMLGFRSAKTIAGILILTAVSLTGLSYERLGILVLLMIPFWLLIIWKMKKAYSKLLRSHLLNQRQYKRSVEAYKATDVLSFMHDEKAFHEIQNFMSHRSTYARKLASAAYFAYSKSSKDLNATKRMLQEIIEYEAVEETHSSQQVEQADAQFLAGLLPKGAPVGGQALKHMLENVSEETLMKISETIRDSEESLESKRRAIRLLEALPNQQTTDLLLHRLADRQEHALRFLMLRALLRIRKRNSKISINRLLVKSEIAREMTLYDQILKVRAFYKAKKKGQEEEAYVDISLRAILDENMERIFQCLKLLYPGEVMATIYQEFIRGEADRVERAHALELLFNTLEPDLLIMMERLLNEHRSVRWSEREMKNILRSFLKSQDRWFSLIGQFLVTDLGLDKMWPEMTDLTDPPAYPFAASPAL